MKKRKWHNYLWIASALYIVLGFVNIFAAWIGLICFFVPIIISLAGGGKAYCNRYCGRGQLFQLLGGKLQLSRNKAIPAFLRSKAFRIGFLIFFFIMFGNMIFATWLVFSGTGDLKEFVTLLWTIRVPWQWANTIRTAAPWVAQFAFGFYSIMLTSTLLGIVTMLLYKPRSWCVYCPMGTMTQIICKLKHEKKIG
jgi:hypothetical protein